MHGFKSAILAIFHFCQNGTFEPVHEIQKIFWPKAFLIQINHEWFGEQKSIGSLSWDAPHLLFSNKNMYKQGIRVVWMNIQQHQQKINDVRF